MLTRSQYRCSFKLIDNNVPIDGIIDRCKENFEKLIRQGKVLNASFYRYENMGFLYMEENSDTPVDADQVMGDLKPYLKR